MSKPIVDRQGRRRNVTVAFRVSPEESELLNRLVDASGATKQDYLISCIENCAVKTLPNTRMQRGLTRQMDYVYRELRRLQSASEMAPELATLIERITDQFEQLGHAATAPSEVELENDAIRRMGR